MSFLCIKKLINFNSSLINLIKIIKIREYSIEKVSTVLTQLLAVEPHTANSLEDP